MHNPEQIRNIAIIAHVDHGKTTLVDAILRQTGVFRQNEQVAERILDSNDIERERGITILAKNTAVMHRGYKLNLVDTPGHADFSGEVERILTMVEGALLLVDAFEGPMPQTKFVVEKALQKGITPILVVNKIDRPGARPAEVVDEVLDLLIQLGAEDDQIDFPIFYASARYGVADEDLDRVLSQIQSFMNTGTMPEDASIQPLLDAVIRHVPQPGGELDEPLQMLITILDHDEYLGRVAIGRIFNGRLGSGETVVVGKELPGKRIKLANIFTFGPLKRLPADEVGAGDIAAFTGYEEIEIGDTVMDSERPQPLPPVHVDEPTLTMTFRANDSPFAGREGKYVTSRQLRERLFREAKVDVSLRVEETDSPDTFRVSGRGELHLGILLENMRREGYELQVSKPDVIWRREGDQLLEPIEEVLVEVPDEFVGTVIERLGERKGEMLDMQPFGEGMTRLKFLVPSRGLIGFRSEFLTETKGYGVLLQSFAGYDVDKGEIAGRTHGSLIAWETGATTSYALENAQERGVLFVGPGEQVYAGMIVGRHAREGDLEINVCKKRHVTNMRSSTAEIDVRLTPPMRLSLEQALAYIADDEWVEITPLAIRLRKKILDRQQRARQVKQTT